MRVTITVNVYLHLSLRPLRRPTDHASAHQHKISTTDQHDDNKDVPTTNIHNTPQTMLNDAILMCAVLGGTMMSIHSTHHVQKREKRSTSKIW